MVVVSIRSWLVRHPRFVWLATAVAGAAAVWGVADAIASLERARQHWGETVTVWVATRDLAPGDLIDAESRSHPRALVSSAAIGRDPAGLVALQHLAAGETVTQADVGRSGLELLPADWRGVAVVVDASALGLAPGHRIEVVAGGQVLAHEAIVITVADDAASATVGVPRAVSAAVADAAARGELGVVLRPD